MERDISLTLLYFMLRISTHTLTWSVTDYKTHGLTDDSISTHTLTWSVTYYVICYNIYSENFNSHAHVERDGVKNAPKNVL